MREALFLTSNGVPFDVAFSLPDHTRAGFCIALSEMNTDQKFDWERGCFPERPKP